MASAASRSFRLSEVTDISKVVGHSHSRSGLTGLTTIAVIVAIIESSFSAAERRSDRATRILFLFSFFLLPFFLQPLRSNPLLGVVAETHRRSLPLLGFNARAAMRGARMATNALAVKHNFDAQRPTQPRRLGYLPDGFHESSASDWTNTTTPCYRLTIEPARKSTSAVGYLY